MENVVEQTIHEGRIKICENISEKIEHWLSLKGDIKRKKENGKELLKYDVLTEKM